MLSGAEIDRGVRRLTNQGSRRQMIGGLAGAAVVLTDAVLLNAKSSKSRGKAKGKGKSQGSGGALGQQPKVGVCHPDDESEIYTYFELPPPVAKAHVKHGDQELTKTDCMAQNSAPANSADE